MDYTVSIAVCLFIFPENKPIVVDLGKNGNLWSLEEAESPLGFGKPWLS